MTRIAPTDLPHALATAKAGDLLQLDAGELTSPITIDKAITIEGRGTGTWIGGTSTPLIRVTAPGVQLRHLELETRGEDDVAIWIAADPGPRLDSVRIRRGRVVTANITFAPPPMISLKDAPHRSRPSTRPPIQHVAAKPKPPPPPKPYVVPAPPSPSQSLPIQSSTSRPAHPAQPVPVQPVPVQPPINPRPSVDRLMILLGLAGAIVLGGAAIFVFRSPKTGATDPSLFAREPSVSPVALPAEPPDSVVDPCPADRLATLYALINRKDADVKPVDPEHWERALAEARSAVVALPDCPVAWSSLAHAYYRVEYDVCGVDDTEATAAIKKALQLAPNEPAVLRNHGRILAAQKRWSEALVAFRGAFERDRAQGREWIESLEAVGTPSDQLLTLARSIKSSIPLTEPDLDVLSPGEMTVLLYGVKAKYGVRSNLPAIDWLFFCPQSPLSDLQLVVDPQAPANPTLESSDRKYVKELTDARRAKRSATAP